MTWVGSTKLTELTVTPEPLKEAAKRPLNPAPGSKKPEPLFEEPVTLMFDVWPKPRLFGARLAIVAGGGARI